MAYQKQTYPSYQPPQQPIPTQQHTIIIQNQPIHPVYVAQPYQKSYSERIAGNAGSILGSAVRSGGQLLGNSKSIGQSVGRSAAQAAKSSAQLAGNAVKGFSDEMDRTAKSPLLDCFLAGSGVQLVSKTGKECLRCLPNGNIDGRGTLGNDYSCHWLVVSRWENKVVLRNGSFPQFHLSIINGYAIGTGIGDGASTFKLHETHNHYVRLEHEMSTQYVAISNQQNVARPEKYDDTLFEVQLVYSPFAHMYKPVH